MGKQRQVQIDALLDKIKYIYVNKLPTVRLAESYWAQIEKLEADEAKERTAR